jgi:predicted CopG family antitoxin
MRKRVLTKQVGVIFSEEVYQQLIKVTDKLEISISQFIREIIEEKISQNKGEKSHE